MADPQFTEKCLKYHNTLRSLHNSPELVIDIKLNDFAQEWALTLAEKDTLEHRTENVYGENLYFGFDSDPNFQLSAEVAVQSWYDEISAYKFGEASPENLSAVGHFTQLVWKGSQRLGVGLAKSENGKIYLVCNYDPPGNIVGDFPENVEAPRKTCTQELVVPLQDYLYCNKPGSSVAPETVDSFGGERECSDDDNLSSCTFDIIAFLAGLERIPPHEIRVWLDWLSKIVDAALEEWQEWLFANIDLILRMNQLLVLARIEMMKDECIPPTVSNVGTEISNQHLNLKKSCSSLQSEIEKEKSVVNYDPCGKPIELNKSKSTMASGSVSMKNSVKRSPSAPSELTMEEASQVESLAFQKIPIPQDQAAVYEFIREFTCRAKRYELLYKYWLETSKRVINGIMDRAACDGPVEDDDECPYFFYLRDQYDDVDSECSDWGGPDESGTQWLTCGNQRLYFNFSEPNDQEEEVPDDVFIDWNSAPIDKL